MEISLFPLPNLVLFPHIVVPLHIFEERYKLMINGCLDRSEVLGLVLLRGGSEDETEDTIHRVGVTARVVEAERLRMLLAHLTDTLRKLEQQRDYKELMAKVRGNGDLGKPHKETN